MKNAVFLDRDGVINRAVIKNGKPYPPANLNELIIDDDVAGLLQQLKAAGYYLVVVTNQPDVARGTTTRKTVEDIHNYMLQKLPLDIIKVCYHDDQDNCDCRKPKAGMLQAANQECDINYAASYMIGDRWRDIEAGYGAGCKTILIDAGYAEKKSAVEPNYIVENLAAAVGIILMKNSS